MARYQVILAYDGTEFFGFQRQERSDGRLRTVQATVEAALCSLGWQGRSIMSAGRTDTGVHASGQVIAFDLDWSHSPDALRAALNASLPPDVAAQAVQVALPDFHPRYDAVKRSYCYRLFCQPLRDPLRERFAWRVWPDLDVEKLKAVAAALIGKHDFAAFGRPPRPAGTTHREIYQARWLEELPDGWAFEIAANAFLFHMVRRLVGFQVSIAQGKLPLEAMPAALQSPADAKVCTLAPPHGLTLTMVEYPAEGPSLLQGSGE